MAKKAVTGEEYKVLKQKSTPKKIAKFLIFIWVVFVMAPCFYILGTKSETIKEFAIVKGVYQMNDVLQTQYSNMTDNLLKNVNIAKYTSEIKIPEIKLDKVSEATRNVSKVSDQLAKFGVKEAAKVSDTSAMLQKQVDEVNAQIKSSVAQTQKILQSDIENALKKEVSGFADNQVQKQLGLSGNAYAALTGNHFGLVSENARKATSMIYSELTKSKLSLVKNVIHGVDTYFEWIVWGVMGLLLIVLLAPVVVVWWIAKKLSSNFTECPYCGKVFLSKAGKFNLLKLFK